MARFVKVTYHSEYAPPSHENHLTREAHVNLDLVTDLHTVMEAGRLMTRLYFAIPPNADNPRHRSVTVQETPQELFDQAGSLARPMDPDYLKVAIAAQQEQIDRWHSLYPTPATTENESALQVKAVTDDLNYILPNDPDSRHFLTLVRQLYTLYHESTGGRFRKVALAEPPIPIEAAP